MKKLLVLCFLMSYNTWAQKINPFITEFDIILQAHVKNRLIDYEAISNDPSIFIKATQELERIRLNDLSTEEKKAFLLNAYNFLVIKSIVNHYPVTSPLKIKGFFDQQTFLIDGKKLTLNNIEHKVYHYCNTPLIHFALVCAAKGCPILDNKSYPVSGLKYALEQKAIQTLNDPKFVIINQKEQTVGLSFIFKWYKDHFPKDIHSFINKYRKEDIPETYQIHYYNYDWKLNEVQRLHAFTTNVNILFSTYIKNGMVNYEQLREHPEVFIPILEEMNKIYFKDLTPNELKAFLINAYNVFVIKTIAENYPVTSPLEIEGFFDTKTFMLNDRALTLDNIEHKTFYFSTDPLVHFGLVCAAKGCPTLNNKAFTANGIDEELAAKVTEMLDDPQFLAEDKTNNIVNLSFIFKWNSNHFPKNIINFINRYKTIKISDYAKIQYYNYNWKLNDLKLLNQFTLHTNTLLSKYVIDGMVNYKTLKKNMGLFDPILSEVKKIRFKDLNSKEKKAYLINLYNLLVVKTITENYPVTSPLDIDGFFDKKTFIINNREMTLNQLEDKTFYYFDDPLVHFALVCAAKGCPSLNNQAFMPDEIDLQLVEKTKETLNDPSFVLIDKKSKKVGLSFIFKWYSNHFPSNPISFINDYRKNKVPADYKIYHYNYDWKLNTK